MSSPLLDLVFQARAEVVERKVALSLAAVTLGEAVRQLVIARLGAMEEEQWTVKPAGDLSPTVIFLERLAFRIVLSREPRAVRTWIVWRLAGDGPSAWAQGEGATPREALEALTARDVEATETVRFLLENIGGEE